MTDITANVIVSMPSQLFTMARSFKAVANGKIYIGKIDTDPVNPENQIQVYVENEDGSHVPVAQPIIINAAGYPVYNGQIAKFVTEQGHSMAVYDAYGAQQFKFPNVLKYDPDQFEARLYDDVGSGNFPSKMGYIHNTLHATLRTLQHKLDDILSVKDFGAVGDGLDHPLSEKFSTLSAAQMVYPFVTALTQTQDYAAIQAAINTAKFINAGVFLPSGQYVVNTEIVADYALSLYGEGSGGLRDIASTGHEESPVRGSVILSKVNPGRTLSINSTTVFSFGMTLRDFAIWGVQDSCDVGLYTNHVGWTGIMSGLNIQRFPNQAWEVGYIQDTYVNNCTFLLSGSQDKPAVHFLNDSNYIYFNGCHFEGTPYFIKMTNAWNIAFHHCHFEVARTVNGSLDDRFFYRSAPIDLGASYRIQFSENTFIPTDVGYLSSKLDVPRNQVPYFMTGSGGNSISFSGDIFLAPEGSVDAMYLDCTAVSVLGCKFIRMSPSRECVHITDGHVSNCEIGISAAEDLTKLYGIYVGKGGVSNCTFGFYESDSGGKRNEGALLFGEGKANGNSYPDDDRVYIFLDSPTKVDGYDGGDARFITLTESTIVDLTKVHPSTHYNIIGSSVAITNIYGAPLGRDLIVRVSSGDHSGVKYVAGSVETNGATDWAAVPSTNAIFKCIKGPAGKVMYQL
ncbi:phage tailspike protein [Escherichia coli]|uniref:phage tailspike protein n=1 Tax=Escherichia coli TaxID=562 RepID=UPI00048120F8|nr:phage tailspike protein [Escherichia coli]CTW03411.1 head-binding domain of phage tailspike protein [Escherichia coli]CTW53410.1 head-binding domain of phage tailspike protein [Escherichia coli]CTW55257.1 head-binding domain of phage tailspike protein [Escherichia coli]